MAISRHWTKIAVTSILLGTASGCSSDRATSQARAAEIGGNSGGDHDEHEESVSLRLEAERKVTWCAPKPPKEPTHVRLLAFNDFHGQISAGRKVGARPVGGAAVLASYLKANTLSGDDESTFIVHAGDHVGASPPASALLQDEPSISFLNLLTNDKCTGPQRLDDPRCNIVGTLGNHEFDEGKDELLRLLRGGNHANGPFLENPYRGARFPYVSANVVDATTGRPILPPYVIRKVEHSKIAFIGAVLKETPTIVTPTGVAGLKFLDEADAINSYVDEIRAKGVHAIVVLIHQGSSQASYTGETDAGAGPVGGAIADIINRLNDDVDVVVSGHSHTFTNTIMKNQNGAPILVTQAFSASTAFAKIDLTIDRGTHDVVSKTASVMTTWGDEGPGLTPDAAAAKITADAEAKVAPLVNQIVGVAATAITRTQTPAGESAMGDLIADAQLAAMGTDFAFMNPGGIRADLDAGEATWGELFTIQPFGNSLVRMNLTGAQVKAVLEQQWAGQPSERIMQISGLTYTWKASAPVGSRIVEVRKDGIPLDPSAIYSITCNNFMAAGGDNFTTFLSGTNQVGGPVDLDALIAYIKAQPQPFTSVVANRIIRLD
jgi:5'-nucleotidase